MEQVKKIKPKYMIILGLIKKQIKLKLKNIKIKLA
jgi:hypothetical protein